jgi:hypothetical protein
MVAAMAVAGGSASASGGLAGADRAAPLAGAADEDLVRYLPPLRLKIGAKCPKGSGVAGRHRCLIYYGTCTADCKVTVRSVVVLPGPNLPPLTSSGSFDADQVFQAYLVLNRAALSAIRENRRQSRLRSRIQATDLVTAETDVDRRAFRFKRG